MIPAVPAYGRGMVSGESPAAESAPSTPTVVEPAEAARLKSERKKAKRARKAEQRRQRRKRLAVLWIVIGVVATVLYAVVLITYGRSTVATPAPDLNDTGRFGVFLQPTEFAPAAKVVSADVSVQVPDALAGDDRQLDSEVRILLFTGTGTREIIFTEGTPVLAMTGTTTLPFDSGQFANYPIDRYGTYLGSLVEVRAPTGPVWYPVEIAVWGDLSGWRITSAKGNSVDTDPVPTSGNPLTSAGVTDVSMRRSGSTVAIVAMLLASMLAVAAVALVVAFTVSRRLRRTEATMASWFAALLFAMVPLRLNMPGAPPIGVWIDFLVFMWVLLALMLALVVFIWSWVRFSPRPEPPTKQAKAGKDKHKGSADGATAARNLP